MLSQLLVFHKFKPTLEDKQIATNLGLPTFQSCLRTIVFADSQDQKPQGFDVMEAHDAYSFLLSVICGLESPVLGETEIMGQFKNFIDENQFFLSYLKPVFKDLLRDAKIVRAQCLQDLGSQSYGSVLRKIITSEKKISIIGFGSLAQEFMPWLVKDSRSVKIFVRDIKKYQEKFIDYKFFELKLLQDDDSDCLILAAPLSSKDFNGLRVSSAKYLIDLRGESRLDPILTHKAINLDQVFSKIESSKKNASVAKERALEMIEKLSEKRFLSERPRPFGWEDIHYFGNCFANK